MLLTAFFWYPTLSALRETPRYVAMMSREANPAHHDLGHEWLLPLLAPNILGNPVNGTYAPPRGFHPAVLNDYGEIASGYAGLLTLALALACPFIARGRPIAPAVILMIFSFLTIAEAPLWRDVLREIPLIGISIHQRLRIFWVLGVCIAAALSLDALTRRVSRLSIFVSIGITVLLFSALYAWRSPAFLHEPLGLLQFVVPLVTVVILVPLLGRASWVALGTTLLVLIDLAIATYRYNPSSRPEDLYPVTGAIATLQRLEKPFRFVAMGWSFLPDTPGYYGIEDVKTTDPIQNARYMRLLRGYLDIEPASYDLIVGNVSRPFFDYLNIRYVYLPVGTIHDPKFAEIYRGVDGVLLENRQALPRYFLARRYSIEPDFDAAVWRSREITDYREETLVDHVPQIVARQAEHLAVPATSLSGGEVDLIHYGHSRTVLEIESDGWQLLVTSDVNWPGWRAYWNGVRQPTVTVNGAFLGCFIPPGNGRLTLRYIPNEFSRARRVSIAMSALFLLALSLGATRHLVRRLAR